MDKTDREVMQQALEALEANQPVNYCMNNNGEKFPMMQEDPFGFERNSKAIAALRARLAEPEPRCGCHKCNEGVAINGIPFASTRMILCPTCGNKRCPHASDHRLACTDSNEPGQAGSVYALAEPVPEPVAYPEGDVVGPCICGSWPGGKCLKCPRTEPEPVLWLVGGVVQSSDIPADYTGCLYARPINPPARRPLTDEEIDRITRDKWGDMLFSDVMEVHREFARAVIAKAGGNDE